METAPTAVVGKECEWDLVDTFDVQVEAVPNRFVGELQRDLVVEIDIQEGIRPKGLVEELL